MNKQTAYRYHQCKLLKVYFPCCLTRTLSTFFALKFLWNKLCFFFFIMLRKPEPFKPFHSKLNGKQEKNITFLWEVSSLKRLISRNIYFSQNLDRVARWWNTFPLLIPSIYRVSPLWTIQPPPDTQTVSYDQPHFPLIGP